MAKKHSEKSGAEKTCLTFDEQQKLVQCERSLRGHTESFHQAGLALKVINTEKLYLGFGTFDDYCRQKWGMSPKHAYRLIKSYEVLDVLQKEFGSTSTTPLPTSESHVRPLTTLEIDKVVGKWKQVVKEANGKPITAEVVEAVLGKTVASKGSTSTKNNGKTASITVKELTEITDWITKAKAKLGGPKSVVEKLLERIEKVLGKHVK